MHFVGRKVIAAVLLAGVGAPVYAADLPDPVIVDPIIPAYGGWYLRGHIGMSNQRLRGFESPLFAVPEVHEFTNKGEFDSAPIFALGIGYQYNDYLRGDLTVEYRGGSEFRAADRLIAEPGDPWTTNDYAARKSEWLMLANAYADLGTYYGITPYIGAGIGTSRNTISGFRDINYTTNGGGYAPTTSKWNLAWALHAGLGIKATERMTVDLGYSYVNLGDAWTGSIINDIPGNFPPPGNPGITFKDLTSHDLKLGVRYSLN